MDEAHPEEIDLSHIEYVREFLRLEVLVGAEVYAELLGRFRDRLAVAEPFLYKQALSRARLASHELGADERLLRRSGVRIPGLAPAVLYRLLMLPFVAAAKWMESRRRALFPGGLIYSNSRVIRSHLRRSWDDLPADPDGLPAAQAFSNVASDYQERVVSSPANRHMRSIVRQGLEGLVHPGDRILDLGAGTGADAVWLAERGALVLAVDVAEGMVQECSQRVADAGLEERVEVRRLAIEDLRALLPTYARRFNLVLTDFGALNLCGDPDRWAPVVARLLKPGGRLVASVMNRWAAWELGAGLIRGRPSFAFRRARSEPISIGGVALPVALYTPGGFARSLRLHFHRRSVRGLCALAPPPVLEHLGTVLPGLGRLLDWLDRRLGGWPGFRALGDHFLIVLEQCSEPILRHWVRDSITASPVVADVNGDGAPEIVVASKGSPA